jgi:hypothetical protein
MVLAAKSGSAFRISRERVFASQASPRQNVSSTVARRPDAHLTQHLSDQRRDQREHAPSSRRRRYQPVAGSSFARGRRSYGFDLRSGSPVARSTGTETCSMVTSQWPSIFRYASVTRTVKSTRSPLLFLPDMV